MKGRLRNSEGEVVENDKKADILADYFEKVQWRVRLSLDAGVREPMGPMLNVKWDVISLEELQVASKAFKFRTACGVDEILVSIGG